MPYSIGFAIKFSREWYNACEKVKAGIKKTGKDIPISAYDYKGDVEKNKKL